MGEYTIIIVVSALGFFALAATLLIPVYRFLKREERLAEELDDVLKAELHRRNARSASTRSRNGTSGGADTGNPEDDGGILRPR